MTSEVVRTLSRCMVLRISRETSAILSRFVFLKNFHLGYSSEAQYSAHPDPLVGSNRARIHPTTMKPMMMCEIISDGASRVAIIQLIDCIQEAGASDSSRGSCVNALGHGYASLTNGNVAGCDLAGCTHRGRRSLAGDVGAVKYRRLGIITSDTVHTFAVPE